MHELQRARLAEVDEAAAAGQLPERRLRPDRRAFEAGERFAEPFANAHTVASGLRVPAAVGDFMMLDAIRQRRPGDRGRRTGIREWMALASARRDCHLSRNGRLRRRRSGCCAGWLDRPGERVVIFNTGAAQKYPEAMPPDLPRIADPSAIDWDRIAS